MGRVDIEFHGVLEVACESLYRSFVSLVFGGLS